jgi:hypothetical protein
MVPIIHGRTVAAVVSTVTLVAISGCGGDTPTPEPTTATTSASSTHPQSWDAAASSDNKVRFLVPVELYRPDSRTPELRRLPRTT